MAERNIGRIVVDQIKRKRIIIPASAAAAGIGLAPFLTGNIDKAVGFAGAFGAGWLAYEGVKVLRRRRERTNVTADQKPPGEGRQD